MNLRYTPAFPAVRVTDAYAANAFRKETDYLLSLETGRLLAGFRENAGIETAYVRYGGWESSLIGGHTLGHVLSALAHACSAAEGETKRALLRKLGGIVDALAECQDAMKSGLVWGALPVRGGGPEAQFDNVERGKTDIRREAWVPWYTLHKLLNGLIDVCTLLGGESGELCETARRVAVRLGGWAARRTLGWDEETRKSVLSVEYGGMNDCLYALYALTDDPVFARAAHVFDEEDLFGGILARKRNFLDGKHANTTIPKILGALNRYLVLHGNVLCGETVDASRYLETAKAFFDTVVTQHTYVTGGNSEWEHFGRDGVLDAERTNCNCETCNAYNMLKLARGLFAATGEKRYLDYYDNTFVNDILASQNPETGMTTYFQPMAGGFFKVFSEPYDRFWCCTGSGMESFSKLGDGIYYENGREIVVARYLSSEYSGKEAALSLRAEGFGEKVALKVRKAEGPLTLRLRIPDWCAGTPIFRQNGRAAGKAEAGFLVFEAAVGDEIEGGFPAAFALVGLPDAADVFAVKYGGVVLASDLGTEDMRVTETGVGVNIPARRILPTETLWFEDVGDVRNDPGKYFRREGETAVLRGAANAPVFGPYYRRYRERYALYYRFRSGTGGDEGVRRDPIDSVQPGYGQYEADALHEMRGQDSVGVPSDGVCRYARAEGYFEYDLAVDPRNSNVLEFYLRSEDNGKPLKVTAEGETLFDGRLLDTMGEALYAKRIPIPPEVLESARKKTAGGREYTVITVRFEGDGASESARVCETVRIYSEPIP